LGEADSDSDPPNVVDIRRLVEQTRVCVRKWCPNAIHGHLPRTDGNDSPLARRLLLSDEWNFLSHDMKSTHPGQWPVTLFHHRHRQQGILDYEWVAFNDEPADERICPSCAAVCTVQCDLGWDGGQETRRRPHAQNSVHPCVLQGIRGHNAIGR